MHAAAAAVSALTIVVSPGDGGTVAHWTLRCGPAGGTLPHAALACRKLARLDAPFAPVPPGTVCTELFGGPQTARVTGRYRGHRVWARFSHKNGCETGRWQRLAFLFTGGNGS